METEEAHRRKNNGLCYQKELLRISIKDERHKYNETSK